MIFVGIIVTLFAYIFAVFLSNRTKMSLLNPILVSSIIIIGLLNYSPITYEIYDEGASYITKALGPLVVILAVPLYKNKALIKKHKKPIVVGVFSGIFSSIVSVLILSLIFNIDKEIILSLMPKSITSPMALEVSDMIGGIKELTVVFVTITGIIGATIGPLVFKVFGIYNDTAKGIALGAGSHGVGTAKAVEISEEAGAASSLSMGISGVVTIMIAIIVLKVI
jgi:predicted murein hydrolase (TIGR00659 family)